MKNIKPISLKAVALLLATAFAAYSCKKDDAYENYTLTVGSDALYFHLGQTQTVKFTKSANVGSLVIESVPEGWTALLNTSAGTITITAPESLDCEADDSDDETEKTAEYGTVVLRGTVGERTARTSVWVTLRERIDLTGQYSNCYILTRPLTGYIISAARPDGSAIENISSVSVEWMSHDSNLIRFATCDNGKIYFRTTSDDDDELVEGNAVLAAKDSDGHILWCWHLWVTKEDPAADGALLNGYTFMNRNLGSFANSTEDDEHILASYGLYYQWGRPTPFPRPEYYNCAYGMTESLYNDEAYSYSSIKIKAAAADSENSTMAAAIASPLLFVTDLTEPFSGTGTQWNDTEKSICDPCPMGWRVPAGDAFEGLSITADELAEELDSLRNVYGWTLTDGENSAFFFAGGRRQYMNGSVVNMNRQETPQPWVGFYWTTTLDASRATAAGLFFDLNTDDAAASTVETARRLQLSNGLQIRCVKE